MSATAGCLYDQAAVPFRISHPFHPRRGEQFALRSRHQAWGEDRVMYFDSRGRLRSLLTSWTDVWQPDAFALAAGGRSWFRIDDLLALGALVDEIGGHDVK